MFIGFHGATKEGDEFVDRGPVYIRMETANDIIAKLNNIGREEEP